MTIVVGKACGRTGGERGLSATGVEDRPVSELLMASQMHARLQSTQCAS
jgi:hypothetical protein